MNRYHSSKIYKLVNSVDERIYVGSTCMRLTKRKSDHKKMASKKPNMKVYQELNIIGWDNINIILIEEFKCENKDELTKREQYHIELLKPELNKRAANGQKCIHNRIRIICHEDECKGSQICEHKKLRSKCVNCHGGSICIHNKRNDRCKICFPKTCEICNFTTAKGMFISHLKSKTHANLLQLAENHMDPVVENLGSI